MSHTDTASTSDNSPEKPAHPENTLACGMEPSVTGEEKILRCHWLMGTEEADARATGPSAGEADFGETPPTSPSDSAA